MIIEAKDIESFQPRMLDVSRPCDFSKCPRKATIIIYWRKHGEVNQRRNIICARHMLDLANGVLMYWKFKQDANGNPISDQ